MKNENEIDELLKIAVAARLEGCDFLSSFTYAQLADGYNGIGPEFLPPLVREKVSDFLHIFKPAAVGHDLRNEMSDGTRESFRAANDEFYRNCLRLADYHYPWYSRSRYRARAAALVLYAFVSAEHFGWRAWLEAKDRHAEKMASGNPAWKTKEDNMKKLMIVFAVALALSGCSVTKVNYERDETGKVSYRLYRNDHWLKTSGTGLSGGMTKDGKFEFAAEGLERSPSEEFNRTMQTYTSAFVQLAQIAAAAYNPSASASGAAKTAGTAGNTTVNVSVPAATNATAAAASAAAAVQPAEDCPDCVAK